jgi:hypothetical protein
MHRTRDRLVGAGFGLLALACLIATAWIVHRTGIMQGTSEEGRLGLSVIAVLVHLAVPVCGIAMFTARNLLVGALCGVIMLCAAAYSAWQIANFAATEVISVTAAREATEKREAARNAAAIEAAKERQRTQAALAKEQLKWLQGTAEETRGRTSRKDYVDAGQKLIAEMGKGNAAPPPVAEPKAEAPPLRTDALAVWLAKHFQWDLTALQASPPLWLALMLIVIEVMFWPLFSYFWNRAPQLVEVAAAPVVTSPPPPEPTIAASEAPKLLAGPTSVAPLPEDAGQPEPARVHPSKLPPPTQQPRQPLPGSVQALIGIGFPLIRPAGPQRPKEAPKTAAYRFSVWARCMGLHGDHGPGELYTLYREFADADHREPTGYNALAAHLDARGNGISKTRRDGAVVWVIAPGRFRAKTPAPPKEPEAETPATAEPDAPAAEEGRRGGPFASSRGAPPMRLDRDEPAWLHANRKALRRWRLAQDRKQRGVRMGRRAAA